MASPLYIINAFTRTTFGGNPLACAAALAAIDVLEKVGARIVGCTFVIDLPDLGGADRLRSRGLEVRSLCEFEGD